jgi:hypothetical protein
VTLTASNGTATAGTDYTGGLQIVTFPAGVASMTVNIPILNPGAYSSQRTVNLTLSSPSSGAFLGAQRTVRVVTIIDRLRITIIDGRGYLQAVGSSGVSQTCFLASCLLSGGSPSAMIACLDDYGASIPAPFTV